MQHRSWPRHQSLAGRQHIQSPSAASRSSAAADNSMQYSLDKMSEASPEGATTQHNARETHSIHERLHSTAHDPALQQSSLNTRSCQATSVNACLPNF